LNCADTFIASTQDIISHIHLFGLLGRELWGTGFYIMALLVQGQNLEHSLPLLEFVRNEACGGK